jgi:diaminopimelate epimerase
MHLVKAHAYGNDFLLVQSADVPAGVDGSTLARDACDRHRGLGADGLLLLDERAGLRTCLLLNADGSRSEVSGNGTRCVAAWVAETEGLNPGAELLIGTEAGPKAFHLLERRDRRWTFRSAMGAPVDLMRETLIALGERLEVVTMRMGNPQCVVLQPVSDSEFRRLGPALASHARFPAGTNVEFVEVRSEASLRIRIWERGVGPTEASGTGACASAVAAAAFGGAGRSVDVEAPGGTQHVHWTDDGVSLTGWAELVADMNWHAR